MWPSDVVKWPFPVHLISDMPKSCTVHRSISLVRSSNEATWRRVLTFQVPILNSSRSWLSFPVVFPSALWWASSQDKGRDRVGCPLLSPPGPEVPPWYARLVAAPFLIVVIMKWICCSLQGQKSTIGVGALILPRRSARCCKHCSARSYKQREVTTKHWCREDGEEEQTWPNIGETLGVS